MSIPSSVVAASLSLMFLLAGGLAAHAAEISVLSSYGMRAVMLDVAPKFEQTAGHKLTFRFANPRVIAKQIRDAGTADVVVTAGVDFTKGQVLPGSATAIARTLVGLAVRNGAPKPDISSSDAVKHALLTAKSISHDDGPAGRHLVNILEHWSIADRIESKTILGAPPPRRVGDLVASGEVEIGVHVISLMIGIPGIEIVGPLPAELQRSDPTSAAIMAGARDIAAAKALVEFLRTPAAAAVIKAKGMEPATP